MKIKRFFAKDMRTALAEVKETLGPDAVIMSNKKVTGGVEIVAAVDYQSQVPGPKDAPVRRQLNDESVNISSAGRQMTRPAPSPAQEQNEHYADTLAALLARQQKLNPAQNGQAGQSGAPSAAASGAPRTLAEQGQWGAAPEPAKPKARAAVPGRASQSPQRDQEMEGMRKEMASIRKLLEHQISGLMWQEVERREPMRALLIKELKKIGFDDAFADQLAGLIPEDMSIHQAMAQLAEVLTAQLKISEDEILRQGGAVALLGPTGVGKTTTIAKLAARFAMKYGAEQVALITTDNYRIGAHEQLQTYGRIMGCPVRQVRDAEELANALYQFRHRRLVLIDTAGVGQRDIRLTEQLDTLVKNAKVRIRSYLVMSATSQRRVMQEAVDHFRRIPLSGCILTKLDESLNLGEVINVCIQNALPISYITDGQRVPEDIQVANAAQLVGAAMGSLERETEEPYFWGTGFGEAEDSEFYE
ncbi:flagellar biosynthesis protein FlhF [Aeromonas hydrophila]|uniref:flagellar biosynthesis protein FlhF n=1 Tax=Aeromonas hydrophila TaxID=644 RepID=UPI00101AFF30|nr:flagellar biosynthesis protein FlhF [Aeromonas hydrophila]MBL0433767.1 flagellar biosynthesis protein FlhF [Aeromonas hydrophila]MBL0469497.1 flagellar biosynthesis protein FlhF [Aeromonas hydrophila]MCO4198937.1 flagellar biosynthesis protein FlhF [Aeromonas hydrophila]NLR34388.1 flagellar biosynthesis protein FlhF [Aeromonas hydrophila]UNB57201.1 flagellar biosynthesis protein FlhF [Aeromonas hydrophila]